jgi:putative DNA primase/helicase
MVSEYDFQDLSGKKAPETAADQPIPLNEIQLLAERITRDHTFKTTTDNGELFWYNGSVYLPGQEWRIKERCRQIVKNIKAHQIREVINYIKDTTYIDRSEFDSNPKIRNVGNGLLNLQTRELEPHRSDYLSIVQLPVNYDPKAECKEIIRFLRDVLKHKDIGIIIRLIGYLLLPTYDYDVVVMLFGTGANGKSTLLRLIAAFLGAPNCSHRSLQQSDTDRFAVASLFGKMANLFADLKSTKVSETGYFKMLSGRDPLPGEFKFKDVFYFTNKAKLWFSANEIPESDDKSDAYYRRWRIIHFDKQFLKGKEDTKKITALTSAAELSGLLNMALTGLSRLQRDDGFHDLDIEEVRRDYEMHTNDVSAFLYEECILDISNHDCRTLVTDVYSAYITFCVKR